MSNKYPAEILGFASQNRAQIENSMANDRPCPFMDEPCNKKSGVCSVHTNDMVVAICPNRFLQENAVMQDIAIEHFGSTHDLLLFKEVYSGDRNLGTFDYVLVQHRPLSCEILDFVIVEFQTVDTTMTGKINRALDEFGQGVDIATQSYKFGLNWANVWKRCFMQILNKGRVLDSWGRKSFWVVQEPNYEYFLHAYGLGATMEADAQGSTVFIVYDLQESDLGYSLTHTRVESTTVQKLWHAFSTNPNIPSEEKFVQRLEEKLRRGFSLKLESN